MVVAEKKKRGRKPNKLKTDRKIDKIKKTKKKKEKIL